VGAPSNQHRKRRSLDQFTSYMALMIELVDIDPSCFEEEVEKPLWVDAMVEEYKSIVKNSVWEVVPILANKSIVGLRWIFKVKQVAYKTPKSTRSYLWPRCTLKWRGLTMRRPLLL